MSGLLDKPLKQVVTLSSALASLSQLSGFLDGATICYQSRWKKHCKISTDAVLVWGRKASAAKGEAFAREQHLPILCLEDGFLRSVALGADCPPFSMVLDDLGIYYDARSPSRLEQLISNPLTEEEAQRAVDLAALWRNARVSKYNHSRERAAPSEPYVLVVDQTVGDASITYGLASASSFAQMLQSAIELYPQHKIILKVHPDVFAGKKRGHFSAEHLNHQSVEVLTEDIHAPALLEQAAAVFCVTSQMGFEALLWQKPVYTFGMPFYAGWGLTTDVIAAPERRRPASLLQLIHAALITYPRYLHPETTKPCQVEHLVAWMALQRQQRERFAPNLYAVAPSRWKKPLLQRFVQGSQLHFVKQAAAVPDGAWQLQWGAKSLTGINIKRLIRVEDGFIRSVGLGADLTRPASWVLDSLGMYYDASLPSTLEQLLNKADFSDELLTRADALIKQLIELKVTKYNLGASDWQRPDAQQQLKQRVILVPGQVESDASIALGSPELKSNLALIAAVRASAPDAYIVYKPHPDVVAGLRLAGEAEQRAGHYCNEIVLQQDMAWMLQQVDEVHTLTSLTGFEALLRGIKVVCYGQPFYAGWGLTEDVIPHLRRQRKRHLPELVAATLILYPTYISQKTGYYTTPEQVILELKQQRAAQGNRLPLYRRLFRKLLALKRF